MNIAIDIEVSVKNGASFSRPAGQSHQLLPEQSVQKKSA